MARRYLGSGTTDSNGVAYMTKDASGKSISGYTGTGSGELDIIASLDNPITEDSLVSPIYEVEDKAE